MFLVFNKQRIISYIVVFSTVSILLCGANVFTPNLEETVQTASSQAKLLPIYSVETEEKKVSNTINCAWS